MSYDATLYFKGGSVREDIAPRSVDPEGKFTFGRAFPHVLEMLDQSARQLGVTEPSRFIWHDPMIDEGELDKLSEEEFDALRRKHNETMFWIPIQEGIKTFEALASHHELSPEFGTLSELEYALAWEVACFRGALREAAEAGETAFHIQCH